MSRYIAGSFIMTFPYFKVPNLDTVAPLSSGRAAENYTGYLQSLAIRSNHLVGPSCPNNVAAVHCLVECTTRLRPTGRSSALNVFGFFYSPVDNSAFRLSLIEPRELRRQWNGRSKQIEKTGYDHHGRGDSRRRWRYRYLEATN